MCCSCSLCFFFLLSFSTNIVLKRAFIQLFFACSCTRRTFKRIIKRADTSTNIVNAKIANLKDTSNQGMFIVYVLSQFSLSGFSTSLILFDTQHNSRAFNRQNLAIECLDLPKTNRSAERPKQHENNLQIEEKEQASENKKQTNKETNKNKRRSSNNTTRYSLSPLSRQTNRNENQVETYKVFLCWILKMLLFFFYPTTNQHRFSRKNAHFFFADRMKSNEKIVRHDQLSSHRARKIESKNEKVDKKSPLTNQKIIVRKIRVLSWTS